MGVHAKSGTNSSWPATHRLFLIGLVGLIVAVGGFTWLLIGHAQFEYELAQQNAQRIAQRIAQQNAQLEPRAAQYDGNWHNTEGAWRIQTISISNNGVMLTVHIVDDQGNEGTGTVIFTGEPIAITITVNASYILNITMILNNATGTQLNVTDNTTPMIFKKAGT